LSIKKPGYVNPGFLFDRVLASGEDELFQGRGRALRYGFDAFSGEELGLLRRLIRKGALLGDHSVVNALVIALELDDFVFTLLVLGLSICARLTPMPLKRSTAFWMDLAGV
jgi:hypothetical protein